MRKEHKSIWFLSPLLCLLQQAVIFSYASFSPTVCVSKAVLGLFLFCCSLLPFPHSILHMSRCSEQQSLSTHDCILLLQEKQVCVRLDSTHCEMTVPRTCLKVLSTENERQLYSGFLEISTEGRLSGWKND